MPVLSESLNMKFSNLKIAARLSLLAGFFLFALLVVCAGAWKALVDANASTELAMRQAAVMTDSVDLARSAQVEYKAQIQEWKNILLRGGDAAQLEKYTTAFKKRGAATEKGLQRVGALMAELGLSRQLVDAAIATHDAADKGYLAALQGFDSANPVESAMAIDAQVAGKDHPPSDRIAAIVDFVRERAAAAKARLLAEQEAALRSSMLMLAVIVIAVLGVGSFMMVAVVRSITQPLDKAVAIAQRVAAGDLSNSFDTWGNDEVGIMLRALKEMHDSLAAIVAKVREGAESIAVASGEIADGNQHGE